MCVCVCARVYVRMCVCVFSSSLNRKQSRRHDEKLLPPLLSPLSDDPPRKRPCDSSSSLSQEASAAGMLPCAASTASTSSSSHRHRRGEGKTSAHVRNGSVSAYIYTVLWTQTWWSAFNDEHRCVIVDYDDAISKEDCKSDHISFQLNTAAIGK